MHTVAPALTFEWLDRWARIPDTPSGRANGRTHGVIVAADGRVIVFHQADDALLTFDPAGRLMSAVGGERWRGAHGLTRIMDSGREYLWLVDQDSAEVVKTTLTGEVVQTLPRPDHPAYRGADAKRYAPTWAAQDPATGEVWVADGYGASLVHRYDRIGRYRATIDGTEGAGRFNSPHGINFLLRGGQPELFISDRANQRVVVYDGEGRFLRQGDAVHSPCGFDFHDGIAAVPELFTGVKFLDATTLGLLGETGVSAVVGLNPGGPWWPPRCPEGWPDLAGSEQVRPGAFNSPHGAAFAPNGDVYVVEWIIGGRITKLKRA